MFLVGTLAPTPAESVANAKRQTEREQPTADCSPWLTAQSLNAGIIKSRTDAMSFPQIEASPKLKVEL